MNDDHKIEVRAKRLGLPLEDGSLWCPACSVACLLHMWKSGTGTRSGCSTETEPSVVSAFMMPMSIWNRLLVTSMSRLSTKSGSNGIVGANYPRGSPMCSATTGRQIALSTLILNCSANWKQS